ncbi:MAG: hypothetical protein AB4372_02860 [Xenococcus sp. (in: cyanobacteria)]
MMKRQGQKLFLSLMSLAFVLIFLVLPANADSESNFSFIAIGDTPYSSTENELIKSTITPAIQQANPPFLVHYGDLKGGGETCSEALLKERRDDIYNFLPSGPIFYTPGDNEWVDCDRTQLKPPVSELSMLDLVRRTFFSEPIDLPASWNYARQPNFPENARWIYNDVLFATVHLTSTNNGRQEILLDDIEAALALVDARDQADRVWLSEAFDEALDKKAGAVVIITQADVTQAGGGACTAFNRINCDAFASFRDNLIREARGFADLNQPRRPVLLVHGDTNPYCWDKDFGGKLAPNLWRLNAWGDYRSPADATKIIVQLDNPEKPFKAKTLINKVKPAKSCD